MTKLTLKDLSLKGQKVLMRVDFNVPLEKDGTIIDDSRIQASLPSIEYILKEGASLILMSHLGRPKGPTPSLSLLPCAKRLSTLLHQKVTMAPDCIGPDVKVLCNTLKPQEVILLENLRFHDAEEHPEKSPSFAKELASLGTVYVNDAFGTAHRAHSSTATISQYFPHKAAMGFLMEKEVAFLQGALTNPKRPFYAILGGAKLSSKIGVVASLTSKVDALFIGGGMAFAFLKLLGKNIGNSIYDASTEEEAKKILNMVNKKNIPLYLPEDIVIADQFDNSANSKIISAADGIPDGWQGLDIGPKTISTWSSLLSRGATLFWNGPMGVFEFSNFAKGTYALATYLANLNAITIVGGGESVAAINQLHLKNKFAHVSTGGGASLEMIEFGHLPGVDVLSEK